MNRVTRSTVVLAVALAALSCKGDPTDSLRNGVDHLVATPSSVFLDAGESSAILIEAVDEQGNRQATTFNLGTVGAGITVVEDDSFNLVFDKNGNQVKPSPWPRALFNVDAGAAPVTTSFTVSAAGEQITIPVRVLPTSVGETASAATFAVGDTVTLTVAAPVKFTPGSTFTFGGVQALVVSFAADSSSVTLIPPPTASGTATVTGVALTFLPGTVFTLQTATSFTVASSQFVGKDDPTTAPSLGAGAAVGDTLEFFDSSDFVDQFYRLDAPAGSIYVLQASWVGTADVDLLACNIACSALVGGTGGATSANPENLTLNFSAAVTTTSFNVWLNLYAGAPPTYYRLRLIRTQ